MNGVVSWLLSYTENEYFDLRRRLGVMHDALMFAIAFILANAIAVGISGLYFLPDFPLKIMIFIVVSAITGYFFELNSGAWRYASIPDLIAIVKTTTTSILAFVLIVFLYSRGDGLPRLVPFLLWFLMLCLLAGPRILYRVVLEGGVREMLTGFSRPAKTDKTVIIYNINEISEAYIRAMRRRSDSNVHIAGVIDDAARPGSRTIQGLKVLGGIIDIETIVSKLRGNGTSTVSEICIADQNMSREQLGDIVAKAADAGLRVSVIPDIVHTSAPNYSENLETKPLVLRDLIGRSEIQINLVEVRRFIEGKTVLITGAGGSIGSEIARQIARHNPKRLIITDSSEHFLYKIDTELRDGLSELDLVPRIADVRNRERIDALFSKYKPDVVFHAAALKHVPMVEQNICEAIKTNVLGTRNCANAAVKHNASVFVMISSDKAVNPTNIMGATKRAAETYCQSLDLKSDGTRFKTVRFGNVLDSNGSVVPRFTEQIAKGGPVTVTHPNVVRFFMTIPEAVRLVLHASAIGLTAPEERGKIVILNMGEPVRIVDLAERMIRLAGLRPGSDIKIEYIGLRPGEKLYEELFDIEERKDTIRHDTYFVTSPKLFDYDTVNRTFNVIESSATKENTSLALSHLLELVPEYSGSSQEQFIVKSNPSAVEILSLVQTPKA